MSEKDDKAFPYNFILERFKIASQACEGHEDLDSIADDITKLTDETKQEM